MNDYEGNGTNILMRWMKIAVPSHELKKFIICFI